MWSQSLAGSVDTPSCDVGLPDVAAPRSLVCCRPSQRPKTLLVLSFRRCEDMVCRRVSETVPLEKQSRHLDMLSVKSTELEVQRDEIGSNVFDRAGALFAIVFRYIAASLLVIYHGIWARTICTSMERSMCKS